MATIYGRGKHGRTSINLLATALFLLEVSAVAIQRYPSKIIVREPIFYIYPAFIAQTVLGIPDASFLVQA